MKIVGRLRDASGSHVVCASGDWAIRKRVDLWSRLALHSVNRAVEHAASREDMMSVQPLRKEGDQNPRTAEEAKALVKQVEVAVHALEHRCAGRRVH